MTILIEFLFYIVFPLILIWRGLRMYKIIKDETIKGNIKPLSHIWKLKICPILKEAWVKRKLLKKELLERLSKTFR